jgi:hypothetical protein
MAKSVKPAAKPAVKPAVVKAASAPKPKVPAKAKAKPAKSPSQIIESANEVILRKLRVLNIAHGLQGEIEWCLASYRNDGNPIGLYQMARRALGVFQELSAIDASAVEAPLIAEIEAAIKAGD